MDRPKYRYNNPHRDPHSCPVLSPWRLPASAAPLCLIFYIRHFLINDPSLADDCCQSQSIGGCGGSKDQSRGRPDWEERRRPKGRRGEGKGGEVGWGEVGWGRVERGCYGVGCARAGRWCGLTGLGTMPKLFYFDSVRGRRAVRRARF